MNVAPNNSFQTCGPVHLTFCLQICLYFCRRNMWNKNSTLALILKWSVGLTLAPQESLLEVFSRVYGINDEHFGYLDAYQMAAMILDCWMLS